MEVADEQDRHFRILFALLGQVRHELEGKCRCSTHMMRARAEVLCGRHLSYGLVHLPSGRMKSREVCCATAKHPRTEP